eukprot:EG_transcript_31422
MAAPPTGAQAPDLDGWAGGEAWGPEDGAAGGGVAGLLADATALHALLGRLGPLLGPGEVLAHLEGALAAWEGPDAGPLAILADCTPWDVEHLVKALLGLLTASVAALARLQRLYTALRDEHRFCPAQTPSAQRKFQKGKERFGIVARGPEPPPPLVETPCVASPQEPKTLDASASDPAVPVGPTAPPPAPPRAPS